MGSISTKVNFRISTEERTDIVTKTVVNKMYFPISGTFKLVGGMIFNNNS